MLLSQMVYQAGMGRCAHDSLSPVLYGQGRPPVWEFADGKFSSTASTSSGASAVWWPHFMSRVIEMETSSYDMVGAPVPQP